MSPAILDPSSNELKLLDVHTLIHQHKDEETYYTFENYLRKCVKNKHTKYIIKETIAVICGVALLGMIIYIIDAFQK
jgi:hypothetical protein